MALERFSAELQYAFIDWLRKRTVKVALFDLDDTLIKTHSVFVEHENAFFEYCQQCLPNLDLKFLKSEFDRFHNISFNQTGVSPKGWQFIIKELSRVFNSESLMNGLSLFESIYTSLPPLKDGAIDTLELCKRSGLRLGLVTHAGKNWTDFKVDGHGLRGFFEHIEIIDTDEHKYKGPAHWEKAIKMFGVSPSEVLLIGDNLEGDVNSGHKIGVKNLVWIPSDWQVYNRGTKPEGIFIAESIDKLVETLCQEN